MSRTGWLGIAGAGLLIVLLATLIIVRPAMPARIVLLTGPEESAYHDLGLRYAEELRGQGLEAEVIATAGASDNVRRLAADVNAVAFAPSIVDWNRIGGADADQLVALGSVGIEPLWLFYRTADEISRVSDLIGKQVVTEGAGTTSEHLARWLINQNGLSQQVPLRHLTSFDAEAIDTAFVDGTIDAVFVTGTVKSPVVRSLLDTDSVSFASFERVAAYAKRLPGVAAILIPEGVLDLRRNIPPQDARLLANATCLIAHKDLHAAVVPIVLVTAEHVRETSTAFSTKVSFPSNEHVTLPLDPAAARFFRQGEVGLSKFLPYRVTRILNYLGFVITPLLAVAGLFMKAAPTGIRIWTQMRLKRLYGLLTKIEKGHAAGGEPGVLRAELDRVDRASNAMFIPKSHAHDFMEFRQFLHDVRDRVNLA